ncbi:MULTISPECIES: MarR family winged helix-turn-helix transcriptional regulator [unclassified Microbacterium]|uniref:MarR family winged helix-turn-helix transcriptional regulator n=1 Tax=unclassified Microbacterium TaxID=2609290 RepID=UPI00160530F2|nr:MULTISPECIES: MarR family winged helix-turn-helix transcriptional regulator [unclassified Microbacterium]QNA93355.1 winged helix-turn-helix transcriptional regulator [Microbacterium sp. Se63.02b]QYM63576.1 MarR family winged helix-turn-helix transcriptional regulator [Microbacterium sp. Se5.02b]
MPDAEHVSDTPEARAAAVRALEAEFGELITHFRRVITENANRVSPGMLPGAYKIFTTIARCEKATVSTLSERMLMDKGQVSRTVRELAELGLVERSTDPVDGRSFPLQVTALGEERLAAARLPQEGKLLRTLEDWSLTDIGNLTRLLHALAAGVTPASSAAE